MNKSGGIQVAPCVVMHFCVAWYIYGIETAATILGWSVGISFGLAFIVVFFILFLKILAMRATKR